MSAPSGIAVARGSVDLVGHEEAATLLQAAIDGARLHHAWLIGGVQGIGKATLAYRFARFVLTGGGGSVASRAPLMIDPSLAAARHAAAGTHPDLATLERRVGDRGKLRSEIVVEDVRDIGSFARKTPSLGAWRIVVVDAADDLNANSANALLKLLEEPPPRSLILLVSHNPGRLLPTIRSRCRILTLRPLSPTDTASVIASYRPDLDAAHVALLSTLAEGRPGHALRMAEAGGIELFEQVLDFLRQLPLGDVPRLHATADKLARPADADALQTFFNLLSWWLGRFITSGSRRTTDFEELVPGEGALMANLAAGASLDRWCEVWEKVGHLVARVDSLNLDRRQVVLDLFFCLQAAFRPATRASA